jgi:hypothetical protein
MYDGRRLPLVVGRTPLLPVETISEIFAAQDWLDTFRSVLERMPTVLDAIYVASPSLSNAIDDWLSGRTLKNNHAPLRALAYVIRMAFRCTPFGICAGIGTVALGETTTLQVDAEARRTRTRPDMGLLMEIARALEQGENRSAVRYVANRAILQRGGRLYVANVALTNSIAAGHTIVTEQRPVSLRYTEAVQFVLEVTREARSFSSITRALASRFTAPLKDAEKVLEHLIEAGVVISELRPSPIGDPTVYLLERFERIDPMVGNKVRSAIATAATLDAVALQARASDDYRTISAALTALSEKAMGQVAQSDLLSSFKGHIKSTILDDAALLAEYWIRIAPVLTMAKFRTRFEERYEGSERMVPLLELVDPNLGLGFPEDLEPRNSDHSKRDTALMRIACDALRIGAEEVELTGTDLDLVVPAIAAGSALESLEIGFHVVSSSREAVDAGEYLIVPSTFGASDGAAKSVGRFADFLGEEVIDRMRQLTQNRHDDGALDAEFVFAPTEGRFYNVAIRPAVLPTELRLGIGSPCTNDEVFPDDLWVGLDNGQFYLWSASRKKRIRPCESHVFLTNRFAPNVGRFLAAIANDGRRAIRGFDWGPAAGLTYLPRIRVGRVVLSRRSWFFSLEDGCDSSRKAASVLERLRARWMLPRYVLLAEGDNQLLIDLDSPVTADLLFDQTFRQRQPLNLLEALPSPDQCWIDGAGGRYNVELIASLLPVAKNIPDAKESKIDASRERVLPQMVLPSRKCYGLGSEWTYVKLYISAQAADYFIVHSMLPVIRELRETDKIDRWFFVRYADPNAHLRLRMRAINGSHVAVRNQLIDVAATWLECERVLRYTFDTYDPEYERYGGLSALARAEEFFTIDSEICAKVLGRTSDGSNERIAAAVESFLPWFADPAIATRALAAFAKVGQRPLSAADRIELKRLSALEVNPARNSDMLEISETRRDPLVSLFHMHCNRLSLNHDGESRAISLTRSLLLGRAARATARDEIPTAVAVNR